MKFNRTTEYGLIALRHMNRKNAISPQSPKKICSAREIADYYGFPFEITAKTLQRLHTTGLIQSAQGSKGGYLLQRPLEDISLAEFLKLMEGPQAVVACAGQINVPATTPLSCAYGKRCEIKAFMNQLNHRLFTFFETIRLIEMIDHQEPFGFDQTVFTE